MVKSVQRGPSARRIWVPAGQVDRNTSSMRSRFSSSEPPPGPREAFLDSSRILSLSSDEELSQAIPGHPRSADGCEDQTQVDYLELGASQKMEDFGFFSYRGHSWRMGHRLKRVTPHIPLGGNLPQGQNGVSRCRGPEATFTSLCAAVDSG